MKPIDHPRNRNEWIEYYRNFPDVSVLIVGGGINGIGTFRDLALQGVDVLLVDRADFCSGASVASSHMVHGGIRYLENGEFRLVREAVAERNRLIENAPHYVRPLPTVIPIFKWISGLLNAPLKFLGWLDRPSERGAVVIKIGLMLYDAYTRSQGTVPRHVFHSRRSALDHFPQLNPDVRCAATYYDAAMASPERICIDLLADGMTSNPKAGALNYCPAIGTEDGFVILEDTLSGECVRIHPRVVVNAAGPWIDFTNQALGARSHFIGGTKGSHLVLDHSQLRQAIGEHEFFFENDDGRIVLIYPLKDRVLIGTSDIPLENPDEAVCTPEEETYFLEMVHKIFPDIQVRPEQIVFRFSGVRPLPASDAKSAGQISRDHHIRVLTPGDQHPFPVLSLVGGKWTTFRAFSEQAADRVLQILEHPRSMSTHDLPIGGGRDFPRSENARNAWIKEAVHTSNLSAERLATLLERYGTRAAGLIAWSGASADTSLGSVDGYSRGEIAWLAQSEMVVHLDDLLLRRSLLGMLGQVNRAVVEETAGILAEALGWDSVQVQLEVDRTIALFAERHQVDMS